MPSGAKRRKDGGRRLGKGARNGNSTPEIEIAVAQALAGDVVDCPAFDAYFAGAERTATRPALLWRFPVRAESPSLTCIRN